MTEIPQRPHYDSVAPRFKAWETPPEFFRKMDEEFHFTLDAAASHENHLCQDYFTIEGKFFRGASMQNSEEDGLTGSWEYSRVFCNPPYDASISKWVDKAFQFEAEVAVLLLPLSFDTAWGQRIWTAYQECWESRISNDYMGTGTVEVVLPPGRLRFFRPAFAKGFPRLDAYSAVNPLDGEIYGERIFDYSKPHVRGEAPRAGNLIAIFRR